jgi:hypothetical protein
MLKLIKGTELTSEQKVQLKFNGMQNPAFVRNNSFWFEDNKPCTRIGYYYPVCNSLSYLPY